MITYWFVYITYAMCLEQGLTQRETCLLFRQQWFSYTGLFLDVEHTYTCIL